MVEAAVFRVRGGKGCEQSGSGGSADLACVYGEHSDRDPATFRGRLRFDRGVLGEAVVVQDGSDQVGS